MIGAFDVHPNAREMLVGRRVLLVDDVMTTGATIFAASRALKAAGAGDISALVMARVI
jgi:predicted amidophosphoribosyltransferase